MGAVETGSARNRVRAGVSWEISELANALNRFTYSVRHEERICLFIDGLDEFDGDHQQIAESLRPISSYQHVKLCLPATARIFVFLWPFSKDSVARVDLPDMVRFVRDSVDDQPQMHGLMQANPNAAVVSVNDIVKKQTASSSG